MRQFQAPPSGRMAVDQEGLSGDLGAKNITLTLSRKLRYAVTHTGAVQFVLKRRNKNGFRLRANFRAIPSAGAQRKQMVGIVSRPRSHPLPSFSLIEPGRGQGHRQREGYLFSSHQDSRTRKFRVPT